MKYEVHYMRPAWFGRGIMGDRPNPANLDATHVHLRDIELGGDSGAHLDQIFYAMQGEIWSPNGEARELISEKRLGHTSMSMGDVIVGNGIVWLVSATGFTRLNSEAA